MIRTSLSLFLLLLHWPCGDSSEESTQNPTLGRPDVHGNRPGTILLDYRSRHHSLQERIANGLWTSLFNRTASGLMKKGLASISRCSTRSPIISSPTQWRGRLMIRSDKPLRIPFFQRNGAQHLEKGGGHLKRRGFSRSRLKWRVSVTSNVTPGPSGTAAVGKLCSLSAD